MRQAHELLKKYNITLTLKKGNCFLNSTIGNYRFDATTSITDAERINNAEVKIYPNPFKGSVHIRYELPTADKVAVDILDMQGKSSAVGHYLKSQRVHMNCYGRQVIMVARQSHQVRISVGLLLQKDR